MAKNKMKNEEKRTRKRETDGTGRDEICEKIRREKNGSFYSYSRVSLSAYRMPNEIISPLLQASTPEEMEYNNKYIHKSAIFSDNSIDSQIHASLSLNSSKNFRA